jgi:SAM-dependent methyltransferase
VLAGRAVVVSEAAPHVLSEAYYQRLAEIEEQHWWATGVRAIQRRLLDRIAPGDRQWRVLDAGCGTGLTMTWARRYTSGEPVGIDLAAAGLRFCRGRGHTRLLQGDAAELPFAPGRFDLVLSCDVIQHLPRPRGDVRALAEIARVLAPGGHLLLRTNSRCGYPDEEPELDYHRYTLDEVRNKLGAAGLKPVTLSYINCLPALALTAVRTLKGHRPSGNDPGLGARPQHQSALVRRVLRSVLEVEGMYVDRAAPLPFGHSIIALAGKM